MSDHENPSGFIPPAIEELNQGLSGYEILDLLACGGMGAVYRARQISLDRLVAIKILPSELAINKAFRDSFEAEGKAMAKLSHSNLVGVYDFGEISNMLYLVIEYVEGSNLFQSKGDSAIDPETAVTLIRSVCSGLAEAHHIGLVHRDIKPANILIGTDLVPKLGDFGLAVLDSDIESGLMMGTPAYLAPEVTKDPTSASSASDTYALGVILYEMLTGDSIEGEDVMDLSRVPALGNLQKIVRKAVAPMPLLRYQNGEAMENALNDWIRKPKSSVLAMNPGGPMVHAKVTPEVYAKGGGSGGLLPGLLGLLIVGGLVWGFWGRDSAPDDAPDNMTSTPSTLVVDPPPESSNLSKAGKSQASKDLKAGQEKALLELSRRIAEEYSQNRRDFLQAAGEEGEALLNSVPSRLIGLPRYFLEDEIEISAGLLLHLQKFVSSRQAEIDRKFRLEVSSLHRESIGALRDAKEVLPEGVDSSWERWIEWLGRNPLKVVHPSMDGLWKHTAVPEGFDLHISSTGKQVLVVGDKRIVSQDLIVVNEGGEISLGSPDEGVFHFPWKLRRLGGALKGKDVRGDLRSLRLQKFDYADLLKAPSVAPSVEMTETQPEDEAPKFETFDDLEVETLTKNYRKALAGKIEPLASGYVKVLEEFQETYQKQDSEVAVEQIEAEIERIRILNWREGYLPMSMLSKAGEMPKDVEVKQVLFQKEFERRYEPLRRTYLQSLKKMLRQRKGRGDDNVADIQKAIEKTESVKGAVRARFVKIESLPDEGIKNATISVIDIMDLNGKKLPHEKFSKVEVSSFQPGESDDSDPVPERAIDGDLQTRWTTKWKDGGSRFPHWLSFDLGDEHWITGFQITSRGSKYWNRETDIINWRFYVSPDGRKWTAVAKGNFPKGHQLNEHLGFDAIE